MQSPSLSPYYAAAILNSHLTEALWTIVLSDFKAVFPELKGEWIEQWPLRRIAFTTPPEERARRVEGKALAERMIKAMTQGAK